MRRAGMIVLVAGMCFVLGGCGASTKAKPSTDITAGPAQRVDAINIIAPPTALDVDGKTGVDGVPVTVYLFRTDKSLPLTLRTGALSFDLYGGRLAAGQLHNAKPLRTWMFSATELKQGKDETMIGTCYKLMLSWGTDIPATPTITLVARYVPTAGRPTMATPISLATRPR